MVVLLSSAGGSVFDSSDFAQQCIRKARPFSRLCDFGSCVCFLSVSELLYMYSVVYGRTT